MKTNQIAALLSSHFVFLNVKFSEKRDQQATIFSVNKFQNGCIFVCIRYRYQIREYEIQKKKIIQIKFTNVSILYEFLSEFARFADSSAK